jgi:type II secretory pathway pseudopilin PulG
MKSGFSLVEAIIVMAMLGAASLVTVNIMKNQNNVIKFTEVRLDELEIYRQIQLNLALRDSCTETFVNRPVGGAIVPTSSGVVINKIYKATGAGTPSGDILIESPKDFGAFELSELKLTNEDPSSIGSVGNATLYIKTTRKLGGIPATKVKKVGVTVDTNATTGAVQSCYTDDDGLLQAMCEALQGTWNSALAKCNTPKLLMSEICVSFGGTWLDTTKECTGLKEDFCPNIGGTWDPTTNSCKGLVKADAPCPPGQVIAKIDATNKIVCRPLTMHTATLALGGPGSGGAGTAVTPIPNKTHCSLARSQSNPRNPDPPRWHACVVAPTGGGNWQVSAHRNSVQKDGVNCVAICY